MMLKIVELCTLYKVDCNITLYAYNYTDLNIGTDFDLLEKHIGIDISRDIKEHIRWFRSDIYA